MTEFQHKRTTPAERQQIQSLNEAGLRTHQLKRLNDLLAQIVPANQFYRDKFAANGNLTVPPVLGSLSDLNRLPFTVKQDLINESDSAGFAKNLTFAPDAYTRFHRTSGTSGRPMIVLDTQADWNWWMEAWQYVLDSADLTSEDRVLMAFSFGPFIGFWSAFDAVAERGAMVIPTGAMTSLARLELIQSTSPTVIFSTPSYAIHLAQVAEEHGICLAGQAKSVKRIVVAGEPGGSIPATKAKIESAWDALVIDHCGASEVGPWGFTCPTKQVALGHVAVEHGIFVNEAEFIAEFIPIQDQSSDSNAAADRPVEAILSSAEAATLGQAAGLSQVAGQGTFELVLTCLGRIGSPIIRYRTGDLVRPVWDHEHDCRFVKLAGGVLGRADDMMIIRGVNVFPSSIEQILREFPEVVEFRTTAYKQGAMDQLKIEIEAIAEDIEPIRLVLQNKLGFRVDVDQVANQSLPRFEAKGKRFVDNR